MKAFVKGAVPVEVPATYKKFPINQNLADALRDLRMEGSDFLEEIARDYGLNPAYLWRIYATHHL